MEDKNASLFPPEASETNRVWSENASRKVDQKFKLPARSTGRSFGGDLGRGGSLEAGVCRRRPPWVHSSRGHFTLLSETSFAPPCFQVGFLPPACVIVSLQQRQVGGNQRALPFRTFKINVDTCTTVTLRGFNAKLVW